nr:hypothetical protein L204_06437 [Cryptococcus depauperatus CBS 7855]
MSPNSESDDHGSEEDASIAGTNLSGDFESKADASTGLWGEEGDTTVGNNDTKKSTTSQNIDLSILLRILQASSRSSKHADEETEPPTESETYTSTSTASDLHRRAMGAPPREKKKSKPGNK